LSDPSAREVIIKVLAELHYSYSRLLVEEGTYRSKVDTLRKPLKVATHSM